MLVFHLMCQRELSSEIINHLSITSWDSCYFSKGLQIILMVLKVFFQSPFFLTTERASSCTFFKVLITFLKNDNTKAIVWYPMSAILWNARWTTGKRNRFSSRWLFFASICVWLCCYLIITVFNVSLLWLCKQQQDVSFVFIYIINVKIPNIFILQTATLSRSVNSNWKPRQIIGHKS